MHILWRTVKKFLDDNFRFDKWKSHTSYTQGGTILKAVGKSFFVNKSCLCIFSYPFFCEINHGLRIVSELSVQIKAIRSIYDLQISRQFYFPHFIMIIDQAWLVQNNRCEAFTKAKWTKTHSNIYIRTVSSLRLFSTFG